MNADLSSLPQGKRQAPILIFIALALAVFAILSFTVYSPEESGELYSACLSLGNTLAENDAVAVFLGMTDTQKEDRIREEAQKYIEEHNGNKDR